MRASFSVSQSRQTASEASRCGALRSRASPGDAASATPENESPTACMSSYRPYPPLRAPGPPSMTTWRMRLSSRSRQRTSADVARPRGIAVPSMSGDSRVHQLRHEVKALAGVAELPPKGRVGMVGQGLGPVEEGIGRRRVGAKTRGMVAPAEAEGRLEVPVVEEIPQNVGPRRLAAVPFDEGAVGKRLDDDVPLAVEGRGRPGEEGREERERRGAEDSSRYRPASRHPRGDRRLFPRYGLAGAAGGASAAAAAGESQVGLVSSGCRFQPPPRAL